MQDHDDDQVRGVGGTVSRRRAIAGAGAVAGAAWVAPQIISAPAASAATLAPGNVVAVGNAGTIVVTVDATTWILATSGVPQDLEDVAYSPILGLYAAVGDEGRIVTSPDGFTWTPRLAPTGSRLFAVIWVPFVNRFVAVGAGGTILVSADGITWSSIISGAQATLRGIATSGTTIVVVGDAGVLLTSTDGTTFVPGLPITSEVLEDVEHSADLDLFLAIGSNGEAWTSPDAATWTAETTGSTVPYQFAVWNAAEGAFVAVADDASESGARFDGTTWVPDAGFPPSLFAITYSFPLSLFVAVGVAGIIATSVHGIFWTPAVSPTAQRLNGVAARS